MVTRRLEADLLAEHQLPLASYDVLVQLVEAPERRLRMTELAERVLLSRSGLTRLVDRLEREGLVRREACDDDARGLFAVLTEDGFQRLRAPARRTCAASPTTPSAGWTRTRPRRWPSCSAGSSTTDARRCRPPETAPSCAVGLRRLTGGRARRGSVPALALLEVLEQLAQLGAQEVAGGDVADGDAQRGQLAGEVVGVGDVALGAAAVLLVLHAVAVGLPVLREQDQRRGVGRLQRQDQRQEDERVVVELELPLATTFQAIQTTTKTVM